MRTIKTDREVVEGALALIESDGGWAQGTYCRDANGREVQPVVGSPGEWVTVYTEHVGAGGYRVRTEPGATPCSFCLEGAVRTAAGYWHLNQAGAVHEQADRVEDLLLRLANASAVPGWLDLHAYNDDVHTTQADVVLLLKRAVVHLDGDEHP
ncbi:hypothetical protein AU184_15490 [Mycolicibacterium novocastrense]|uniref:DUF6197 family protein n=1 Tax=Mycolicibacterium novocastrense TaxID=59813 RepID=UPI000747EA04|nr:hypothetical protein [Mycolicibacterium novocastrense]KUH75784.1 hypothetical protein AU183_00510 [Mycolicibacterium novocastrense]KUH78345.1 hypothetical protein AU072_10570 [Mycolicibacterium novocastrense]KUH79680.1 hypothetical protein AU184_15490 [Mycolicibacterium novocastrense]